MEADNAGAKNITGWERERRIHFDKIVEKYDKVRWDYPDELFADAIRYAGSGTGKKAIEIGAGTGKATAPFLNAGYAVTAVELGDNMSEFLAEKFKDHKGFDVITSSFEEVQLEENNYDLIFAASAFHWVDATVGCPKVFRSLRSGGAFILIRNNAVPPDENELHNEIKAAYDKHYYSHYKPDNRMGVITKMTAEDFCTPAELHRGFRFEGMEQYGFVDIKMNLYNASRTYSADKYIELLDTFSDHRALPSENRELLFKGVKEAIIKHGGYQKTDHVFQLYMGRKK